MAWVAYLHQGLCVSDWCGKINKPHLKWSWEAWRGSSHTLPPSPQRGGHITEGGRTNFSLPSKTPPLLSVITWTSLAGCLQVQACNYSPINEKLPHSAKEKPLPPGTLWNNFHVNLFSHKTKSLSSVVWTCLWFAIAYLSWIAISLFLNKPILLVK